MKNRTTIILSIALVAAMSLLFCMLYDAKIIRIGGANDNKEISHTIDMLIENNQDLLVVNNGTDEKSFESLAENIRYYAIDYKESKYDKSNISLTGDRLKVDRTIRDESYPSTQVEYYLNIEVVFDTNYKVTDLKYTYRDSIGFEKDDSYIIVEQSSVDKYNDLLEIVDKLKENNKDVKITCNNDSEKAFNEIADEIQQLVNEAQSKKECNLASIIGSNSLVVNYTHEAGVMADAVDISVTFNDEYKITEGSYNNSSISTIEPEDINEDLEEIKQWEKVQ